MVRQYLTCIGKRIKNVDTSDQDDSIHHTISNEPDLARMLLSAKARTIIRIR